MGNPKEIFNKNTEQKEQKTLDKAYCSVLQYNTSTLNLQNGKDYSKKTSSGFTWDGAV
jgi:hypothetical protein